MAASSRILLVEGRSDEAFFDALCEMHALKAKVRVAPPRILGGKANNKEGLLNLLPLQLEQLADGSLERLALIVDADFPVTNGLGFAKTYKRVEDVLREYGFSPVKRAGVGGLLFSSSEDFHDIGLWIMPDNKNDGMLEDWVKAGIIGTEAALFARATNAVHSLPQPKFKPLHVVKAEVATWLAWQDAPGRGMEHAAKAGLLDQQSLQYKKLLSWLTHIFA